MIHIFAGRLVLDEKNEYIVSGRNLSELLNKLYMNETVATYSLSVDGRDLINKEEAVLYKNKSRKVKSIYVYYINGLDLDELLLDNENKIIGLEIKS